MLQYLPKMGYAYTIICKKYDSMMNSIDLKISDNLIEACSESLKFY